MKNSSLEAYDLVTTSGKASLNERIILAALDLLENKEGTCLEISRKTRLLNTPFRYLDYHGVHKRLKKMVRDGLLVEQDYKSPVSPSGIDVTVYKKVQ